MQVRPGDLPRRLGEGLGPVYLVSGDETLLVQEACDAIVESARQRGHGERNVVEGTPKVDWSGAFAAAGNLSLLAERRILDVRMPPRGFDRQASDALRKYLAAPFEDTVLLLRTERLEARQRSSAWFKAIDAAGVVVLVWPLGARELPRWLDGRCRAAGLQLSRDALALLAERVEGNLLAAVQEIEKLKLAGVRSPVDADTLADAVGDASHFDTFELIDAACAGEARRARKMVRVLRQEGVPVFMILGALASQLRNALRLAGGERLRLPPRRARTLERLAGRMGKAGLEAAMSECALLDLQAKGMLRGDAWQSLERIVVALAGAPVGGLEAELDYLRHT